MFHITLLIFCVLYVTHFSSATEYTTPVIQNGNLSEIVTEARHNLTLLCEGKEKITWTYPNNTYDGTYWSTINIETYESKGTYFAKLTLMNASFVDVDYYYCHSENVTKDDNQRSSKIYVFVRDNEHLSVKPSEEIKFITAYQYSEVILPCRPTSPDISVSLFDINEEPVTNIPYHRHEGYRLKTNTYDSTYSCTFIGQKSQEELTIIITIISETKFVPRPFIDGLNGGKTSIGATYTLNCTVTVDQNVYFTLNWIIPNPDAEKSGRISKTTTQAHDINGVRQGSSTLTIRNVQFEDGGEYTCNIVNHNYKNNSGSKNITVFDSESSYINLQEENGSDIINVTAGFQTIQWVVNVDSFPTASIEWKNNKGDEIMGSFRNNKYFTDYNNVSNKATLKIHQITLNDSGIYQIVASSGKTEKKLNLTLNVQD